MNNTIRVFPINLPRPWRDRLLEVIEKILVAPEIVPHQEWVELLRLIAGLGRHNCRFWIEVQVLHAWKYTKAQEYGAAKHHLRVAKNRLRGMEVKTRRYEDYGLAA